MEGALGERIYVKGIKISDAEMESLDIAGDTFHPEWKRQSYCKTHGG